MRALTLLLLLLPGALCANLKNDIKNSVVRIMTSYQKTDYYIPWRWRKPAPKSGQGLVISDKLILTQASTVLHSRLIEMRLESETTPTTLKIVSIDLDNNLALLSGDLPEKARPLTIPEKSNYVPSAKIEFFWKTGTGRFLAGSAVMDRVETFKQQPSFQAQLRFACANATMSGGYGEPVFLDGKFIGIATHGGSSELYILPTETIHRCFDLKKGVARTKTAVMGFKVTSCTQPYLREKRGLTDEDGGCMVRDVFDQGAGSKSLEIGDILLELGGYKIDAWGRYEHPVYGTLSLSNIISATQLNDQLKAVIVREDEKKEIDLDLSRIDDSSLIIPYYRLGEQSDYYIIGGFIFQNLSVPYLRIWGNDWANKAPEDILTTVNQYKFKVKNEEIQDLVIFSHTLAHPVNRGLHDLGRQIVTKVNGKSVKSLKQIKTIFEDSEEKTVELTLHPGDIPLLLSPTELKAANKEIMLLYGLEKLENFSGE